MIAMRTQYTAPTATPFALPDAPLAMPLQVIEHEDSFLHRLLSGLRSGVPAQGN
jgi:hypothetical protein